MDNIKKSLSDILLGKVSNPSIEIEVEGETQTFEGREAKVFAYGVLAGAKIAQQGATLIDLVDQIND